MPSNCSVAGCSNSNRHKKAKPDLIFHRFPGKNQLLQKRWVHFCRRQDPFDPKNGRVCSAHFEQASYERDLQHELLGLPPRKKLKMDAVPSIFAEEQEASHPNARAERSLQRSNKKMIEECLVNVPEVDPCPSEVEPASPIIEDNCSSLKEDRFIIQEDKIRVLEHTVGVMTQKAKQKDKQIEILRSQLAKLKRKNKQLTMKTCKCVSSVPLTPQQQQRLHGKRVNWKTLDIVRALTVRSVGLKAYETARKYWKLPLPSVRTLQRWAANFSCEEGLLQDVLAVMKGESTTMQEFKRICSISFDEMNIHSDFVFDKSEDMIRSNNKAQVLMVRGLFDSWKQPIFYDFDRKMDKQTLEDVITALEGAGFHVVSITSDLGPDNRTLWKSLGINEGKTYFQNPADKARNIYVFADVPHMVKLIRNHLLDDGLILEDGTKINKFTFQQILEADDCEIKLCPNLNADLINVTGAERMRVKYAVRLLSHRVSMLAKKVFPDNPSVHQFIKTVNDGFDVLDSRVPVNEKNPLKSGYGMKIGIQDTALEQLQKVISSTRFLLRGKQRKVLLPCQIGFIVSIRSTMQLFKDLQQRYGISYMLTSRLNQDALESLFSSVRAYGGPNQNPSPTEFKYRLRLILLGSNLRSPRGTNVEYEDNVNVMSAKLMEKNKFFEETRKEGGELTKGVQVVIPDGDMYDEDALEYLAGYVAWKIKRQGKGIHGTPTPTRVSTTWIASISRGGLLTPEGYFYDWIKICNDCFNKLDGSGFFKNSSKTFLDQVTNDHPQIPLNVAKEFVSIRLKIRTKFLNAHKGQLKKVVNTRKAKQFSRSKKLI